MGTRLCHADADANSNGIRIETSMSLLPFGGGGGGDISSRRNIRVLLLDRKGVGSSGFFRVVITGSITFGLSPVVREISEIYGFLLV